MDWKDIVELLGGSPVYLPPRDHLQQTSLLVLTDEGVGLAEPLYDMIVPSLDLFGGIGALEAFGINGESILDSLGDIVVGFIFNNYTITISVFAICIIISAYLSNKLAKHIHIRVNGDSPPESVIGLLNECFGENPG